MGNRYRATGRYLTTEPRHDRAGRPNDLAKSNAYPLSTNSIRIPRRELLGDSVGMTEHTRRHRRFRGRNVEEVPHPMGGGCA